MGLRMVCPCSSFRPFGKLRTSRAAPKLRSSFCSLPCEGRGGLGRDALDLALALLIGFRRARSKTFAFGEFISFDKRQKKRTKEKRFPRRSKPIALLMKGFSDSPSWLGRKTAHFHVHRPPDLRLMLLFTGSALRGRCATTPRRLSLSPLCFVARMRRSAIRGSCSGAQERAALPGPLRSDGWPGTGRRSRWRAGCPPLFESTWMYFRKAPGRTRTRSAWMHVGRFAGVCFLLVTFSLHKQRKVTRPKGRKPLAFEVAGMDSRLRGNDEQQHRQSTPAPTWMTTHLLTSQSP